MAKRKPGGQPGNTNGRGNKGRSVTGRRTVRGRRVSVTARVSTGGRVTVRGRVDRNRADTRRNPGISAARRQAQSQARKRALGRAAKRAALGGAVSIGVNVIGIAAAGGFSRRSGLRNLDLR